MVIVFALDQGVPLSTMFGPANKDLETICSPVILALQVPVLFAQHWFILMTAFGRFQ